MKEIEDINIEIGNISISAINIQLTHSFGFSIFCKADNKGIEEEISRIQRDIVFLTTIEKTNIEEVIRIVRNSKSNSIAIQNIMDELGYTKNVVELILNLDLIDLTRMDYQNYRTRLTMYKEMLTGFLK